MKISVILAHPNRESFNHAIAQTARAQLAANDHDLIYHDLYAEQFDPLLHHSEFPENSSLPRTVQNHCREIAAADGIVIVHPNWWGQPPAILKGWVDRVFRPGVAYNFLDGDSGEGVPVGLLKAKAALVFNTSNTPAEREIDEFGDPLELLWKNCIFDLCGVDTFYRHMFTVIVTSTREQRRRWLKSVEETVNRYFPPGHLFF